MAVEGILELHDLDADLARSESVEHPLRGIAVVVGAHAGVVAAHDEVRTAVVLPDDGMEYGFTGPGVAHRGGENRQQHPGGRQVLAHQSLVAADALMRRNV